MKIELTITEIAARLGVSERTALRRIADGKLSAQRLGANRYLVSTEDIEELAPQAKLASLESQVRELQGHLTGQQSVHVSSESHIERLQKQVQELAVHIASQNETIEDLHQEVEALSDRVSALERGKKPPSAADVKYEVSEGTIPLAQLADELGIKVSTFRGHLKNQGFEHIAMPKPGRVNEYTRYFTPEQAEIVRAWHTANSKKSPGLWE